MAEKIVRQILWMDPAWEDLASIAEYIALDKPGAADRLVERIVRSVERLRVFPESGRVVPEFQKLPYREVIVPPCRVIYRVTAVQILIVLVIRGERQLDQDRLLSR